MMKNRELKAKLCNKLVEQGKVKEGQVIRHSYTNNRLENGEKNMKRVESQDNTLSPTLDTRCDCLGVVVDEVRLVGGIGEKKSNGGTQYYEQNRIYDSETIGTAIPAESSFHPYYQIKRDSGGGSSLRIRKLTPKETIRLMGFTDSDYQAMRDIGMSDNAIYHMAGDSIVVTVLMSIFSTLLFDDDRHKQIVKDYIKGGIIEER